MTEEPFEHRVVISGVGISEVARVSEHSPMRLALDSIKLAIEDAGLTIDDIDGISTFPGPTVEFLPGFVGPDLWNVIDALRLKPRWNQANFQGAAQQGAIFAAVLAVAAGLCRHCVVFRTTTEGSGSKHGREGMMAGVDAVPSPLDFLSAVGAISPVSHFAWYAQRYMHEYGLTREQLAWLPVTERIHAANNPKAIFREPLSHEDYLSSRMISTPLCLFDCDVPLDASTAFVISAKETVPDLRAPINIEAIGTSLSHRPMWHEWDDMTTMASHDVVEMLWERTSLRAADVDVLQCYDGFSIIALMWLEALGFCGRGEAGAFIEGGHNITYGGTIPMNTWGGQLSGGRLHGFGFPAEAVLQLRGEAGDRQVPGAEVAAVGVGGAHYAGVMMLTR